MEKVLEDLILLQNKAREISLFTLQLKMTYKPGDL